MTPSEMTLLILAGGESTRMGTPKHLLPVPEGTMLDRIIARIGGMFSEVVVVGRSIQPPAEGILVADDIRSERCPLVGILSGLVASKSAFSFVLACDMPFVEPRIIKLIASKAGAGADVVVPVIRGLFEPALRGVRTFRHRQDYRMPRRRQDQDNLLLPPGQRREGSRGGDPPDRPRTRLVRESQHTL